MRGRTTAWIAEGGPEVVYRMVVPDDGRVFLFLQGDADGVDVDVHLLSGTSVEGGTAVQCVGRANAYLQADVAGGVYWVVVDSYTSGGVDLPGPYVLRVDFAAWDEWRERVVAQGVRWRSKLYPELFGGVQTVNVLEVDLERDGVEVRPVDGEGCERTSSMGRRVGAVGGVNGGFFASGCASVSLLKIDGQLLATNAVGRASIGLDASGQAAIQQVVAGADWPDVVHALGGGPNLVSPGAGEPLVDVTDEGFGFEAQRHPRTALGVTGDGRLLMVTLDGRTEHGIGVDLYDLGQYFLWLGADRAMNLDGGGSTCMYVAGASPDGVVNYPSDAAGERAVSNGLFVFAEPYDHPPRFTTEPPLDAEAGIEWIYDADAIDLDVDDRLFFTLAEGPGGMQLDENSGVARWRPAWQDAGEVPVVLAVSDDTNQVHQEFTLVVRASDADGSAPDAGPEDGGQDHDAGPADDGSRDGDQTGSQRGCGCGDSPTPGGSLVLLAILVGLACRRFSMKT